MHLFKGDFTIKIELEASICLLIFYICFAFITTNLNVSYIIALIE